MERHSAARPAVNHPSPKATGVIIVCVVALVCPSQGEAPVGESCLLGFRGGLAAPVGVLAEMEPAGWTGTADFACPVGESLEAGAQLEVSRLEDLAFTSVLATVGLPLVEGGTAYGLFVRPQLHAGVAYQVADVGAYIPERPPRETLAEEFVFTGGAGLDVGSDPPGFVPVFVGGRWYVNFNNSEDFNGFQHFPDVPGFGELHRVTVSAGVLVGL